MMNIIKILTWIVPKRLKSTWILLSITSFGVLASVTLLSVGLLYSNALAEGGLRHTFALASPSTLNIEIQIKARPMGFADYESLDQTVKKHYQDSLGNIIRKSDRSGKAIPNLPITLSVDGKFPDTSASRAQPFFLTNFENNVALIEGRLPKTPYMNREKGVDIETVVGVEVAKNMGWEINQSIYTIPFKADPFENIRFILVGLVEPQDPLSEYWMTSVNAFFQTQEINNKLIVPFHISEQDFFEGIGNKYPSLLSDYGWNLLIDTNAIPSKSVGNKKESLSILDQELNKVFPRTTVFTRLGEVITKYQKELNISRVPIFLFLSLVVVVVLYFLTLILGILNQSQHESANILRSRGATVLQMTTVLVSGEIVVVVISIILGPFIGLSLVKFFLLDTIKPYGGANNIPVQLSPEIFALGAIGGILSAIVLITSSFNLSRTDIVDFLRLRARPPTIPLLHRYYLDFLFIVLVGIIWWQIEDQQGFFKRNLSDRTMASVDISMLMGPVILVLAAAFIIPRFLPPILKVLAWSSRLFGPPWASLTLTKMARDPLKHVSLVIMIMLVTTLGVLGASFQSTLSKSVEDKNLFSIGGDLVVKPKVSKISFETDLKSIDGVNEVSRLLKLNGGIVAINPQTLPSTSWFRNDIAGKNLTDLFYPLTNPTNKSQGLLIPSSTKTIGMWVKATNINQVMANRSLKLHVRLKDASGEYHNLYLGDIVYDNLDPNSLNSSSWQYLESDLPINHTDSVDPIQVSAIFFQGEQGSSLSKSQEGIITIDDITIVDMNTGKSSILENFEEIKGYTWHPILDPRAYSDRIQQNSNAFYSGNAALQFSWIGDITNNPRGGVILEQTVLPFNAIGSPATEVGEQAFVKSNQQMIPVLIKDKTKHFPSITDPSSQFTIINIIDYENYIDALPTTDTTGTETEFWLSLDNNASRKSVIRSIQDFSDGGVNIVDSREKLNIAIRNPLSGGGWNGLTIISLSVLTIAIAVALFTSSIVSLQNSSLDITIARILGLSKTGVFLSIVLERILVGVIGMLAGTMLGISLSNWILGFLDITADGTESIPTMVITINQSITQFVYLDIIATSFISIALAFTYVLKLDTPVILRNGNR